MSKALPRELEYGTLEYLNKELSTLLDSYGLESVLDQLSILLHENALYAALEYRDYPLQVEYDRLGDRLSDLSYHLFKKESF